MKLFAEQTPWYVSGLAFECTECGRCCAGPEEGYVWVTRQEIDRIAEFLGMNVDEFAKRYTRKVGSRFSLIEQKSTNDCIFLTERDGKGRGCRIYSARPTQCRTWPFWSINIRSPETWALAGMRCEGINRGPLVPCEEIRARADATRE